MKAAAGISLGALAVVAWTAAASYAFLWMAHLLPRFFWPEIGWQWWVYLFVWRDNAVVARDLQASGALALLPVFVVAVAIMRSSRSRIHGPSLKRQPGDRQLIRGVTDNHGHSDWMSIEEARKRYHGASGLIIGEAYRPDLDSVSKVPFDARDRKTWGQGGTADLLVDDCSDGPTHGITFAPPGGFKTSCIVTGLAHPRGWRGSVVVLDPSAEIGPMVKMAREAMGHRVIMLAPGFEGPNVLDWIDISDPLAETNVHAMAGLVYREPKRNAAAGSDEFFHSWGKLVVVCLMAHMLWDSSIPAPEKTLRRVRAGIVTPENEMRAVLRAIHGQSESTLARHLAGSLMGLVDETFSGVYGNANQGTAWLSVRAYADLVSGSAFRTGDVAAGDLSIFIQIPLKALQETPAIGRVLIGSLLNACYEADGKLGGRVLFDLDEAAQLGALPQLTTARDTGRKYGVTLRLWFQSVGQLEGVWQRDGRRAWYDAVSWRAYASVQDIETAKEVSETLGQYSVMASSEGENSGRSSSGLASSSRNRGSNQSFHEVSRQLLRGEEVIFDMRADEMVLIGRGGGRPIRCGRPIWFRRKELVGLVDESRFSRPNS